MLKNKLENLIDSNDALKKAYFWSGGNSYQRKNTEEKYSVPKFEFTFNGNNYTAELIVNCSRNNVYVSRNYTKNGKKTNIKTFKTILSKLKEAA